MCRNQIIFIFTNTSRTKQNKKNPEHPFVEIGKQETCAKFQQKASTRWYLELVKVFNFSDKIPGFSKTIDLYLNSSMGFCITSLVLSNYDKISQKSLIFY